MKSVTVDHLCEALSTWTGIPAERLRPGGALVVDPESLRRELAEAIIGQNDAIDIAVKALTRRARLAPRAGERRPLWTALFAGPSGVGKSELAKQLAAAFFGDVERHLVQIDLSDFRDEHTVSRLVGAPPGYKGHGDGGELTNALRRTPTGVLLLDEVEKAHPAVVTQVLLPLLGEGVVHDMNDGRLLDGTQFLVIITSNLGTGRGPARPLGFGADRSDEVTSQVREAIDGYFPKEILGRIDDVVVFSRLSEEAVTQLWEQEVAALATRLSAGGGVILDVAGEVTRLLLKTAEGSIEREGARALRKLVDRALADRCLQLLDAESAPCRVRVRLAGAGGISFSVEPA